MSFYHLDIINNSSCYTDFLPRLTSVPVHTDWYELYFDMVGISNSFARLSREFLVETNLTRWWNECSKTQKCCSLSEKTRAKC